MALPVTTHDPAQDPLIRSKDDLLQLFFEAEKPRDAFRIGPEMEKHGLYAGTLTPIPYSGERGVLRILRELVERHGWQPEREKTDGPLIALVRARASITLEPGGQLELSGAVAENLHQVHDELRVHMNELAPISKELGIRWLGLGFQPFARRDDYEWVPKSRYGIMRKYLPTRGAHALDMMLRTCTVQGNYDYLSQDDAMRKMRVGLALSPLTTAMFANSPFYEGAPHGGKTYRGRVWLDVDPDRSGLVPALWKKNAGYADYVEWALDAPMFMFKRDGEKVANTGQSFRSFWKSGFGGHHATVGDWQTHLNTLFPEVRLKKTIEIRGADAQSTATRFALPALWTGVYYDDRALAAAEALVDGWTHDEVANARNDVWRLGLSTPFRGGTFAALAERLVEIAEGGLERRAMRNGAGKDERVYLEGLKALVGSGLCPADRLLDGLANEPDMRKAIVERAELT